MLLLAISGYTIAFSRLNLVKARLVSGANSIAAVGSINLLNLTSLCESMRDTYLGLFPDYGASLELKDDTELVLNLYFVSGLTGAGGQSAAYKVPKTGACDLTGLVTLPLNKIKVELAAEVKISSFVPLQHFIGATQTTTTLVAEAEAKLTPMDIVILIDNSNSVVSPPTSDDPDDSDGFDVYNNQVVGSSEDNVTSKKQIYTGSCFGFVNKRLKQAAIMLYDVLTSVSSNRVGVAYTNPGQGEISGLAIKLDQSPWERPAAGEDEGVVPDYISVPLGVVDAYSSRCAAITDDYPVPEHPFADWIANIDEFWMDGGNLRNRLFCVEQESCPEDKPGYLHRFDSAQTGLLPREIIWTANAGLFSATGELLEQGNINILEASINRIREELALSSAGQDSNELPNEIVPARKVILYITDGVDIVPSSSTKPKLDPTRVDQFTTLTGTLAEEAGSPPAQSVTQLTNPSASPTPAWAAMHENPCAMDLEDSVQTLGILYFHWRSEEEITAASYPPPFLASYYLPGHAYEEEELSTPNSLMANWRNACQSTTGPATGTFMLETSATEDPDDFAKEIVPAVLKALMLPSIG